MNLDAYRIADEPYYQPIGNGVPVIGRAHRSRMPMMLQGPTGCGKSRFIDYSAWRLGATLITVACPGDMPASVLVGRFLLDAAGTVWQDGPLALAVRGGAICYL